MTTDTNPLQESIARTIASRVHVKGEDAWKDYGAYAAAVLPLIRAAQADALRDAAEHIDGEEPHHLGDSDLDPLNYNTGGEYGIDRAAEWLRTRADDIEQEN